MIRPALLGALARRAGAAPLDFVGELLADEPVGYWRLNEASGSTAANQVSGGSNGTYSAYATTLHASGGPLAAGGYMGVAQPAGAGEMPGMHLGTSDNYTGACTLVLLMRLAAVQPAAGPHIMSKSAYYAPSTYDFPIGLHTNSGRDLLLRLSSGSSFSYDTTLTRAALDADTWYLVHAVYRSNGLCQLCVNGAEADSAAIAYAISSNTQFWRVGSATDSGGGVAQSTADGRYAEVALYDKALSLGRIAAHYAAYLESV